MTRDILITGFTFSQRFQNELNALQPDVVNAAKQALELLLKNPRAKTLRLHPLSGMPKPTIWKIDVFANHSWQITFELTDTTAELKRIGTHKAIDRAPR